MQEDLSLSFRLSPCSSPEEEPESGRRGGEREAEESPYQADRERITLPEPLQESPYKPIQVSFHSPYVSVAPCKRIHEGPGFRIPASRFWIPAFWPIPAFWIPDSKPLWIPDSNPLDSGFQSKNLLYSGFRILLRGAISYTHDTTVVCTFTHSRYSVLLFASCRPYSPFL